MTFLEALALIEAAIQETPVLIADVEAMLCRCKAAAPPLLVPEIQASTQHNVDRLMAK